MQEFEVYLPTMTNGGAPIDPAQIQRIKDTLVAAFGGYTYFDQGFKGAWRMGGVTFHDEVTIVRVLDDGTAQFDMHAFKSSIEAALEQDTVLIITREVRVI